MTNSGKNMEKSTKVHCKKLHLTNRFVVVWSLNLCNLHVIFKRCFIRYKLDIFRIFPFTEFLKVTLKAFSVSIFSGFEQSMLHTICMTRVDKLNPDICEIVKR